MKIGWRRMVPVFAAAVCAGVGVSALAMASKPNPYAYDIAEFKRIPAALLRYEEKQKIPVAIEEPQAIAVDGEGRLYVAGAKELARFDAAGKPSARFRLEAPARCLAVAESGDILAGAVDHVDVYSPDGKLKETWVSLGERAILTSIAAGKGLVWLADAGTRVVWRFDASGKLLGSIGGGEGAGGNKHFVIPSPYFDAAAGRDGGVWIVNPGQHLLERYGPDGKFAEAWGKTAMSVEGFCGCCNPVNIALLADGAVVTSEKGIPRIKVYDAKGALRAVVAGPEAFGAGGPEPDPALATTMEGIGLDLATDASGRVLALDHVACVVHVFAAKGEGQ